jgi:hypothetical protein
MMKLLGDALVVLHEMDGFVPVVFLNCRWDPNPRLQVLLSGHKLLGRCKGLFLF